MGAWSLLNTTHSMVRYMHFRIAAVSLLLFSGCPDVHPPPGAVSLECDQSCDAEVLQTYLAAECASVEELLEGVMWSCSLTSPTVAVGREDRSFEIVIPAADSNRASIDFVLSLLDRCAISANLCRIVRSPMESDRVP